MKKNRFYSYLLIPLIVSIMAVAGAYYWKNHITLNDKEKTMETIDKKITASGLAYIITHEASTDSKKPVPGDIVNVHYTGWLDDNGTPGRMFDSSVERGEPLTFPIGVGYVIKGWDEAVLDMKIGEKRRIFIPSNLGYGARGAGAAIPPHANLIFDVELISLEAE